MPVPLPKFRQDIEITPGLHEGRGFRYLLKDPQSGEIFEFSEESFFLCQALNGENSLEFIQHAFQKRFNLTLPLEQLEAFIRHLGSSGLLIGEFAPPHLIWRPSTYFTKIRIGRPRRLINLLAACFGWCFSSAFIWLFSFFTIISMIIVVRYFFVYHKEAQKLLNPGLFFLETVLGLLVINVSAEFGKAVACKHYRGQVPVLYLGIMYRIIPHLYFEIGESLWAMQKEVRGRVLKAGMIAQLCLLVGGIIAWKISVIGTAGRSFWMTFNMAAFIFFLLNAIPLTPRDGYFWLYNRWEIPDLYNRARACFLSWLSRKSLPEPLSPWERLGFLWFGALSILYDTLFWIVFLLLFCYLFIWGWDLKGLGACLSLFLLAYIFEDFLKRQSMKIPIFREMFKSEGGKVKMKFWVKFGLLVILIIIMLLPYPFEPGGVFKLLPVHQVSIRAVVPGKIQTILVKEGERVKEDQPLAILLDKDQRSKYDQAKEALEEAKEKLNLYKSQGKPEAIAKAQQEVKLAATTLSFSNVEAKRATQMFKENAIPDKELQERLKMRDQDREQLVLAQKNLEEVKKPFRDEEIKAQEATVRKLEAALVLAEKDLQLITLRSPIDGWFITAYPAQTVGQYLEVGDMLGVVEATQNRLAEIEVSENDIEEVKVGAEVNLKPWAYPTRNFSGKVIAIAPVGYERDRHRVERVLTEKEYRNMWYIPENTKVIRVLSEVPGNFLMRTEMTGYAKIQGSWKPVGVAFTRWMMRFVFVEVWSWLP